MTSSQVYVAVDLGASSGRLVTGQFDGSRIQLDDLHRFDNGGVRVAGRLYWNVLDLWQNILNGLRQAKSLHGADVASIGVDTWGVDFGLLGRNDELLGNPFTYRDRQTAGIMPSAFEVVTREEIFDQTGLQFMEFNSLYQLLAMKRANSPILDAAEQFLMIPDLFNWMLTGVKAIEFTNATTTQFFNPTTGDWARNLLDRFQLPTGMLSPVVAPGTSLGKLTAAVAEATGLTNANVVLPGTHDTASAVMAVPAETSGSEAPDWAYISSGTWSLMGMEIPRPIVGPTCREFNFTNEGGVGNTVRLLKNIAGLWLLQECRRIWTLAGHQIDWPDMVAAAAQAEPLGGLIDPDHSRFIAPANMPLEIQAFCQEAGQPVPQSPGAIIRCALESLALRYRMVLQMLQELTGSKINTIHIVGGGAQNELLSQMTADACNCRVVTGPVEATAIGNVMMQAVAGGAVGSISEAREVIRNSFPVTEYTPHDAGKWDDAFERFRGLIT